MYYSTQAITKPQAKSNEAALKEIEEAMKKVKEAQSLVNSAVDPLMSVLGVKGKPSRSRSRTPSRNRDYRRSRSRDRDRRRSRSRSRDRYYRLDSVIVLVRCTSCHTTNSTNMIYFFILGDAAGVAIVEDLEAEKGGEGAEAGGDLAVEEEAGLVPEIGREKTEIPKRKRWAPTNRKMESQRISRAKMGRTVMGLMGRRLRIRKDLDPRVGPAEDHEAGKDAAQDPEIGADPDQNPGKDPNDRGPERGDGDREAGIGGGAEVGQDDVLDLGIIKVRKAREIGNLLTGKRRGQASREIMTRRRLGTRIRRTRSMKLSIWRFLILPNLFYFTPTEFGFEFPWREVKLLMNLLITVNPVKSGSSLLLA